MPVDVTPVACDVQFVVGAGDGPQQVPRVTEAGLPRLVTFAPSVAPVVVMDVAVGEETAGVARDTSQVLPFQEVPPVQAEVTVIPAPLGEVGTSDLELLYR